MPRKVALCLLTASALLGQTRERRIAPVDAGLRQTFEKHVKVALLVGVGHYPVSSGLGALKYPAKDVAALGDELEHQGYLVRRLTDTEASRGIIKKTLADLTTVLDADQSTFLFYFSGHGFQQDNRNYLATYGATADDLKGEGLAVADVETILKNSHARQTMMFIDACRNDPGSGARSVAARTFAALKAAEGMRVLYASRAGSVSYESDQLQHGVFTNFLIRGLKGEAAGNDGLVTFRDLAEYVRQEVRAFAVRTGQVQVPFEGVSEASGDFLLAGSRPAPPMNPSSSPDPFREALLGYVADASQGAFASRGLSWNVARQLPGANCDGVGDMVNCRFVFAGRFDEIKREIDRALAGWPERRLDEGNFVWSDPASHVFVQFFDHDDERPTLVVGKH